MRRILLGLIAGVAIAVTHHAPAEARICELDSFGPGGCGGVIEVTYSPKATLSGFVPDGGSYINIGMSPPFVIDVQANPGVVLDDNDPIFQFSNNFSIHFVTSGEWTIGFFLPPVATADPPASYFFSLDPVVDFPSLDFVGTTPLPAALPLFATGLGILGFGAYRRKRKPISA